ncbi:MAG: hypothetical protein HN478_01470 [Rhodospirillaceae bacterium]|jgi:hypothetical protein|nr:hypothetical protein [Rhodospirillaceae bacterium]MBT4488370.1 hypothetical protein [Rhodospirillaceae bacterium]MBT5191749.1 hypothetical protein [Rhodospirillaceae bacterium]MBT5896033.1 hypothetical protein [Rhodospirillaceae bacterium]MBT7757695.1 hypothetical protein [Rhodospirillaceae bacterium]
MLRNFLFHVVPFLLPFIAYGLYVFATRRARAQGAAFDEAPWYWLFSVGLALTGASLIAVWAFTGAPAGGEYIAPHMENGTVVPGKFN